MKKAVSIILVLVCMLSLAACGKPKPVYSVTTESTAPAPKPEAEDAGGTEQAPEEPVSPGTQAHPGVRPELVEFFEAYEAFIDEYIAVLEKLESAGQEELVSLMTEYNRLLGKYAEYMEAAEKWQSVNAELKMR